VREASFWQIAVLQEMTSPESYLISVEGQWHSMNVLGFCDKVLVAGVLQRWLL